MKNQGLTKIWGTLCLTLLMTPASQARSVVGHYYQRQPIKKLVQFGSCQALEQHINKNMISYRKGKMRRLKKTTIAMNDFASAEVASPSAQKLFAGNASAARAKTVVGTNNQVANVDEADFVKFDGQYIYQLRGSSLKILKAWPANAMNLVSSLDIDGTPREMLISSGHVVVLADMGGHLLTSIIDTSNVRQPRTLTQFKTPGTYKTARMIGNTLRIVNRDYANMHRFWKPISTQANSWIRSEQQKNQLNIRPTTQILDGSSQVVDVSENCKNVWVPEKASVSALTRLISIDLKAKSYNETLAFVNPQHIYASSKNIYLADHSIYSNNAQRTSIHQFSIKKGEQAEYQASGIVKGRLLNQFSMDEYNGHLRVASNGHEHNRWTGSKTVSRVQILKKKGKVLATVGQTKDMAKGERLYSVRFDGDKGYVVTFRQVDPLFTLDLSNPKKPRVMGELKVPGFSTYIHKLGKNHLLTIGKDADERTGRARGLKLTVFDVSNFAKPREVKSLLFNKGVSSEAAYEHKAFNFYADKGILAIPATENSQKSALLLFKVTKKNIKFSGELDMTDMFTRIHRHSTVRRSFFADNVVYAIGESGVRAAAIGKPSENLSTVSFDKTMAKITW